MPKRLRSEAMSLVELLTCSSRYTVPDYQRVYAWGETQIEGLLSDLESALAAGRNLYLGTIYVAQPAPGGAAQIADGQQRIVSFTMLCAGLRDLAEDPAEADRLHALLLVPRGSGFAFAPRDFDAAFFRRWVQERGATLRPFTVDDQPAAANPPTVEPEALPESQHNIIRNRDAIIERLRAMGAEGRARLYALLEGSTQVVLIAAPTLEEARNAYASTQSRGLAQAETDKLKAELIYDCPEEKREHLAGLWEECEASLGREHLAELFQLLVLIASERKPQHALEADLTSVFGLPDKIAGFIEDELVPSAAAFRRIIQAGSSARGFRGATRGTRRTHRIEGHLISMLRSNHSAWKAPAILALRRLGGDPKRLEAFMRDLEHLAAVLTIVGTDPNKVIARYALVLRELKGKPHGGRGALTIEPQLAEKALANLRDPRLAERERYRMTVLLKAEDLLSGDVQPIDMGRVSCEHILPVNPPRRGIWYRDFRDARTGEYLGADLKHSLGNLALLTRADNRLADTKSYDVKRKILRQSGFALSRDAATAPAWTVAVIKARTERLVALLAQYWGLEGA